jgi:hypothetical protein
MAHGPPQSHSDREALVKRIIGTGLTCRPVRSPPSGARARCRLGAGSTAFD